MSYGRRTAHFCKVVGVLGITTLGFAACDKAKSALKDVARMSFTGTVNRAGTKTPIPGANVVLIPLASLDAITSLVEVKKIPDGKGGSANRVRIKLNQVQAYLKAHSDTTKATTDGSGKFSVEAPTNVYLVYTYGPGAEPGGAPDAYGPAFWGINPVTGELDKEHLIGADLKIKQNNDAIQLPGGPVPPVAPLAATPQPKDKVVPPPAPATPLAEQPAPKKGDVLPPCNIVPPDANTTFWTSVKLTYEGGFIGTGGALQADTAPTPEGQPYVVLEAELAAEQSTPVYLIMQKGFDSTYVSGCQNTVSAATTRVYPVTVNGTHVSYQLVPPGPFYTFFLAKSIGGERSADVPSTIDTPSLTLTVGKRSCDFAVPERPFLATLTWDVESDIDLYVSKYDATKVAAAASGDEIGESMIDQANYTQREGTTLTLDVDNTYAYGPENNGDSKAEANPENFCYLVQIHYYAGSAPAVNCSVDVTKVESANGKKTVKQVASKVTLHKQDEWQSIGAYGPSQCQKLLNPPPKSNDISTYPPLADCTNPYSCDMKGESSGQFKPTVGLDKTSYAASDLVKVTYSGMPDFSGNWITLVPKSFPANSWCSWQWVSGAEGTQYYGSLPPGDYEARVYYNWQGGTGSGGGQCEVIGSKSFTVTP